RASRCLRCLRSYGQLRSASVERCLHPTDCRADELCNLLQRVVEHVLKEHTATFLRRQADHETFDCAAKTKNRRLGWLHRLWRDSGLLRLGPNLTLAQKIYAAIMGDPEQPPLQRPTLVEFVQLSIRLKQRFLYDVLAIHR